MVTRDSRAEHSYQGAKVGVTRSLSTIKQDLLLFDKLRIVGLTRILGGQMNAPDDVNVDDAVIADFDYLQSENVVSNAPPYWWEISAEIEQRGLARNPDWLAWRSGRDEDEAKSIKFPGDLEAKRIASKMRHPSADMEDGLLAVPGTELIVAYADTLFDGGETVALLDRRLEQRQSELLVSQILNDDEDNTATTSATLADIVIERLPLPGDDVPMSDILSFSRDSETRRRIRSLRLWMATAAL